MAAQGYSSSSNKKSSGSSIAEIVSSSEASDSDNGGFDRVSHLSIGDEDASNLGNDSKQSKKSGEGSLPDQSCKEVDKAFEGAQATSNSESTNQIPNVTRLSEAIPIVTKLSTPSQNSIQSFDKITNSKVVEPFENHKDAKSISTLENEPPELHKNERKNPTKMVNSLHDIVPTTALSPLSNVCKNESIECDNGKNLNTEREVEENAPSHSSTSSESQSSSSDSCPSTPDCDLDLDVFLGKTSDTDLDLLVQTAAATAVRPEPKPKPSTSRAASRKSFSVRDILGGKRNLVPKPPIPSETNLKPVEASAVLGRQSPTFEKFESSKKSSRVRRDVSHEVASLKDALTSEPLSARRTRKPALTEGVDLSQFRAVRKKKETSVERNEPDNNKTVESSGKRGRPKKGAKVPKKGKARKSIKSQINLSESDSDEDENDGAGIGDESLKRPPEKIKTKILGNIFAMKKAVRLDESRIREGTILVVKEGKNLTNETKKLEPFGPCKRGRKKLSELKEITPQDNDKFIMKETGRKRLLSSTAVEKRPLGEKFGPQLSLSETDEESGGESSAIFPISLPSEDISNDSNKKINPFEDNEGIPKSVTRNSDTIKAAEQEGNKLDDQSEAENTESSTKLPSQGPKSKGRRQNYTNLAKPIQEESQDSAEKESLATKRRRGNKVPIKQEPTEIASGNLARSAFIQKEAKITRETRRLRPKVEPEEIADGKPEISEQSKGVATEIINTLSQSCQPDVDSLKVPKRTRTTSKLSNEAITVKLQEQIITPASTSIQPGTVKVGKIFSLYIFDLNGPILNLIL